MIDLQEHGQVQQAQNGQPRVVVAMSGGVDSSVAAALLVEEGYEVIGMMMRLWSEPGCGPQAPTNRCCTPDQVTDARRVADQLNIPFYVIDVKDYFRRSIVQFFVDQHALGRTPNPCIECNREIRFSYLLERARALGADYLATGHYAQIEQTPDGYRLRKGVDESKDQSYVLHVLDQETLAHVLFPVGAYSKAEVRKIADRMGLPVASKRESMDLCFLGDGDYRRFLREYAPESVRRGPIVTTAGEILGEHEGLPFYTIGQRKGLGISADQPLYVLQKDVARNALIVGSHTELGRTELLVRDVNWLDGQEPVEALPAAVKIRYKAKPLAAMVTPLGDGRVQVAFEEFVFGATAGQGAVFYDDDVCLGGGLIADSATIGPEAASVAESSGVKALETP